MEVALFDYYEKLRLELGPERFPEVWNPDGLAKVLVPKTIYLPDPGPTARRILIILLDCSWDEQLGVGIRLIDEAVDTVGEQTLVL